MTDLEKAARQALEALEEAYHSVGRYKDWEQITEAVEALRQAIEQAEKQEPVAWRYNGRLHEFDPIDWATGPVTPLYTSPPAKPWVGLTDEEIAVIAAACGGLASDFVVDVARAIEQAHGITGETK